MALTFNYGIANVGGGEAAKTLREKRAAIAIPLTPEEYDVQRNQPRREPTDGQREGHYTTREDERGNPGLRESRRLIRYAKALIAAKKEFTLTGSRDALDALLASGVPTVPETETVSTGVPLSAIATVPTVESVIQKSNAPCGADLPLPWYVKGVSA